jgi:hypothetical protein
MNKNINTSIDDFSNGLVNKNFTDWGTPKGGMRFDGVDDYVTRTFTETLNGVSFSIYPEVTNRTILFFGTNKNISYNSSNAITLGSDFVNSNIYINGKIGTTLTLNTWNHITITFNQITATALEIARNGSTTFYKGEISNLRIFNNLLTESKIKKYYNNGRPDLAELDYEDLKGSNVNLIPEASSTFVTDGTAWWSGVYFSKSWDASGFMKLTTAGQFGDLPSFAPPIMVKGKTYEIKFRAKRSNEYQGKFLLTGSTNSNSQELKNPILTTEWQDYHFITTLPHTASASYVMIRLYLPAV